MPYRSYLDHLAEEVNDTLQESGFVSLNVLSLSFTLPLGFLVEVRVCSVCLCLCLCMHMCSACCTWHCVPMHVHCKSFIGF